jgi:hypothetical protein
VKDELISATTKAAPPVGVTAWQYVFGLPVEKWVAAATLCYILVQIYCLIVDRIEKRNAARIARMELRHAGELDRQHIADTGAVK